MSSCWSEEKGEDSFSNGVTQVTMLLVPWRHGEDVVWNVPELPQCNLWLQTGFFHPYPRICRGALLLITTAVKGTHGMPVGQQQSTSRILGLAYQIWFLWLLSMLAESCSSSNVQKKPIQTNFWYFLACYAIKQWREGKKNPPDFCKFDSNGRITFMLHKANKWSDL